MSDQAARKIHLCTCPNCQQHPYSGVAKEHMAINRMLHTLDEKNRRRVVGTLALLWGRGSIQHLANISGLSRHTIQQGKTEIEHSDPLAATRIRHPGGGRSTVEKKVRDC